MILHPSVVKHIAADLTAPLYLFLPGLDLRLSFQTFLHGAVVELRLQQGHGPFLVLRLVACFRILDQDLLFLTCVRIRVPIAQTDTRLHLVHVLTSSTRAAEGIPRQLSRIHIHLNRIVNQRSHKDRCEARHTLALCIERRNTHQSVHTILAFQVTVSIFATLNLHGYTLDARLVTILQVTDCHLMTVSLGPAHIHTHQHRCPVLTLRTAGTRVDLHHAVHRILFLAEHVLQLQILDGGNSLGIVVIHLLLGHHLIMVEIVGQLQLVGQGTHLLIAIQPSLDVLHLLHLDLRPLGVFPEVGSLRTQVFLLKFYLFPIDVQIAVQVICAFEDILQLVLCDHISSDCLT